jgi:hypothetical protein
MSQNWIGGNFRTAGELLIAFNVPVASAGIEIPSLVPRNTDKNIDLNRAGGSQDGIFNIESQNPLSLLAKVVFFISPKSA